MKKRALLLISIFFASAPAYAIVSMENLHFGDSQPGVSGSLSLSGDGALGNSERLIGQGASALQWNLDKSVYYFSLAGAYGESQAIKSQQEIFAHGRRIGHLTQTLSWEIFTQLEHDDFARLKIRALAGSGLRIRLGEKSTEQAFFVGAGAFYSHELIDDQAETENQEVKGNFYFLIKRKLSANASFVNTLYAQPKLTDFGDLRILEHATLKVNATDSIAFKFDYEMRYDGNPPTDVKTTDHRLLTGIEYSF